MTAESNRQRMVPLALRFWGKVAVSADRNVCWPWSGGQNADGYGRLGVGGKLVSAHRVAWELTNGPLTAGESVLHQCDNPPCCNPFHLFKGTQLENVRDARAKGRLRNTLAESNKAKTHCPQGHEYTSKNTYTSPNSRSRARLCRQCMAVHVRRTAQKRYRSTKERRAAGGL